MSVSGGAVLSSNNVFVNGTDGVVIGKNKSANGAVTITGVGSSLFNLGNLIVGKAGIGALTVIDGGLSPRRRCRVAVQSRVNGHTQYRQLPAGMRWICGTHQQRSSIAMGSGTATINFNHTSSNFILSTVITGNGAVNFLAGTTVYTQ